MGQTELVGHRPEQRGLSGQITMPDGPLPSIRTARGPIIPKHIVSQVLQVYAADLVASGGVRIPGVIRGTFSDLGYSDKMIKRTIAHRDPDGRDFGYFVRREIRRAKFGDTVEPVGEHVIPRRPDRGLKHYPPLREPDSNKPPIGSHWRYSGPGAREPLPWDEIPTFDVQNGVINPNQLFSMVIQYMIDTRIRPGKREISAQLIDGYHCPVGLAKTTLQSYNKDGWGTLIQRAENVYDSIIVPDRPRKSRRDRRGPIANAHMNNVSSPARTDPGVLIKRFIRDAAPQVVLARRVQSDGYPRHTEQEGQEDTPTTAGDATEYMVFRSPEKSGRRMAMPMRHGPSTRIRPEVVWDRGRRSSYSSESVAAVRDKTSVKEAPPTTKFHVDLGNGQTRDIVLASDQARLLRVLIANGDTLQPTANLGEQLGMDGYTFGMEFKVLRDRLEKELPGLIVKRKHRGGRARKGLTTTRYRMAQGKTITEVTGAAA